jgi:hypothetical protein
MRKSICFACVLITSAFVLPAHAKYCTQPTALGAGMYWVRTATPQTVQFRWFGGVSRLRLYDGNNTLVYDGPPVDSWNSLGMLGLLVETTPNSMVEITTDFAMPLPECK